MRLIVLMPMKRKRKLALKIRCKFYEAKDEGKINDIGGEIEIVKRGRIISSLGVVISDNQITVDSVETRDRYQRCGYGRLLMDTVKLLAEFTRKPIVLYSLADSVAFYEELEFKHINHMFHRIDCGPKGVSEADMVWIPQSLEKKKGKIKVDT